MCERAPYIFWEIIQSTGRSFKAFGLGLCKGNTDQTLCWKTVETQRTVESEIKPFDQEAYVGMHLSFVLNGKVLRGNAIAANRTREIRPSGMRGGLAET